MLYVVYSECVYSDNVDTRLVSEVASRGEEKIVAATRLVVAVASYSDCQ